MSADMIMNHGYADWSPPHHRMYSQQTSAPANGYNSHPLAPAVSPGMALPAPAQSHYVIPPPAKNPHQFPQQPQQHRRSSSFAWDAPQQDLQPSWNIWGPVAGQKPAPAATYGSALTIPASPPRTSMSDQLYAISPTSKRLWLGAPQNQASSAWMASPPLTPQTSPSLNQTYRSGGSRLDSPPASSLLDGAPHSPPHTHHQIPRKTQPVEQPTSAVSISIPASIPAQDAVAFEELVAALAAANRPLYLVQFKSGRLDVFTASEKTVHPIAVGDLVIVDADRGRDLGKIAAENVGLEEAAMFKWSQHQEQRQILHQCSAGREPPMPLGVCTPKQILRAAQTNEIQPLAAKSAAEAKAVTLCNQKARERGLDMAVVDAEYQWDRRKLTFFYKADQRVDFRDLVRELFRTYKTRIWMCAVASEATEE